MNVENKHNNMSRFGSKYIKKMNQGMIIEYDRLTLLESIGQGLLKLLNFHKLM